MGFYGCIPDERDDRDRKFALPAGTGATITSAHDLTRMFPPTKDQAATNTCTVHGVPAAYRYNRINNRLPDMELSRAQLYWDAGILEHDISDVGRQIRDVVKCLAKTGIAREELWGFDKLGQEPPPEVYTDAVNQTVLEYMRVDTNRDAINMAIYVGHPIIIGVDIFEEFETDEVARTGLVPMPRANQTPVGAHCMLMGAYDPQWDTVQNSWGTWFGLPEKKGFCKLPRGYIEKYGSDLWTIFLDKSNTKEK